MKKFTSIAAALCLATAFSGFCAGCASGVTDSKERQQPKNAVTAADGNVATSAAGDGKVILCPGWNYQGNTKKLNTLSGNGVTQVTKAQAEDDALDYWVENAYFFEAAAGTDLPTPTAGKSGISFVGWRYASDGALETVTKMPSGGETLILYAEWKVGGSGPVGPVDPGENPDNPGGDLQAGDYNLYVNDVLVNNALTAGTGGADVAPPNLVFNYYASGVTLKAGDKVKFVIKDATISLIWVEANTALVGAGTQITGDTVEVATSGTYTVSITQWQDQVSSNKVNIYVGL